MCWADNEPGPRALPQPEGHGRHRQGAMGRSAKRAAQAEAVGRRICKTVLRDQQIAKKRPVGSLPPSKPLTGPAPPRRSVCAPRGAAVILSQTNIAKETTMLFHGLF